MKSCLLTVSEKFERSKVSTNSFDSDSDSSAPILVRDDAKRHTANTTKQIETLDAIFLIPTPSVFVVFWFSGLEWVWGGFNALRVGRENETNMACEHVSGLWDFFLLRLAGTSVTNVLVTHMVYLPTWRNSIGFVSSHVSKFGKHCFIWERKATHNYFFTLNFSRDF